MVQTTRRHFMGGAAGLASMLGLSNFMHVSAQDATAAAEDMDGYVWNDPEWGDEPASFEILSRSNEEIIVSTNDGKFQIPTDPQRIVAMNIEYVPLFELDIASRFAAVGRQNLVTDIDSDGNLTEALHNSLDGVPRIEFPWEPDLEQIIGLEPDLILGNTIYQSNDVYNVLVQSAPFLRAPNTVSNTPRGSIRDYAALFGVNEIANELLSNHDDYVRRAKSRISELVNGRKLLIVEFSAEQSQIWAYPAFAMQEGVIFAPGTTYPFFRELGMRPSNFVESLASQSNYEKQGFAISTEDFGLIDADLVIVISANNENFAAFQSVPSVQASLAHSTQSIYEWRFAEHGWGLAGIRSSISWFVECITGEPFE